MKKIIHYTIISMIFSEILIYSQYQSGSKLFQTMPYSVQYMFLTSMFFIMFLIIDYITPNNKKDNDDRSTN